MEVRSIHTRRRHHASDTEWVAITFPYVDLCVHHICRFPVGVIGGELGEASYYGKYKGPSPDWALDEVFAGLEHGIEVRWVEPEHITLTS